MGRPPKQKAVPTRAELRIRDEGVPTPDLSQPLSPNAYKPYLVKWLKSLLTFEQAAYLMFEENPENPKVKISPQGNDGPSEIYNFLSREYKKKQLVIHDWKDGDLSRPLISLGDAIRYCWSNGKRHIRYETMWRMYWEADNGKLGGEYTLGAIKNYEIALRVIQDEVPRVTLEIAGSFLKRLHVRFEEKGKVNPFPRLKGRQISDLIKGKSSRPPGRLPKGEQGDIEHEVEQAFEKIVKNITAKLEIK